MRSRPVEAFIREAEEALEAAGKEFREAVEVVDKMKLRDTCEKAWLAVVKAADALLQSKSLGSGETYRDRRGKLWELERRDQKVAELGLYDRFGARMYNLHLEGFYDGSLTIEEVKTEIAKAQRYVIDVKGIL